MVLIFHSLRCPNVNLFAFRTYYGFLYTLSMRK